MLDDVANHVLGMSYHELGYLMLYAYWTLCRTTSARTLWSSHLCQQTSVTTLACELISGKLLLDTFDVGAILKVKLIFQEYLSLGTMQRKHFSLEQINSALDFMQSLTCNGELC